jgi:hypothetical protein
VKRALVQARITKSLDVGLVELSMGEYASANNDANEEGHFWQLD